MPLILTGTSASTTLDSSAGLTFSDSSNQSAAASPFGLKNRIINGDMVISQRNGTSSVTPTAIATWNYTLDRWAALLSSSSRFSVQQNAGSVTPPAGFTNYLGVTSLSAYSLSSGDYFWIEQPIEGFNTADLAWGTANARTVTLSFWVRSSLTGTFGGSLANVNNDYAYPFSYTISSANTWTQISVTIAGPTAGTWNTTNSQGIRVRFGLGVGTNNSGSAGAWANVNFVSATGAVSVVGTNGATWYITGVQLERNTTATPFEWIPYSTELALCQRYYQTTGCWNGAGNNATTYVANISWLPMRANPTIGSTGVLTISNFFSVDSTQSSSGIGSILNINNNQACFFIPNFSGLTAGAYFGGTRSGSNLITLSAEL